MYSTPWRCFSFCFSPAPALSLFFTIFCLTMVWSKAMFIEKGVNLIKSGANLGLRVLTSSPVLFLPHSSASLPLENTPRLGRSRIFLEAR